MLSIKFAIYKMLALGRTSLLRTAPFLFGLLAMTLVIPAGAAQVPVSAMGEPQEDVQVRSGEITGTVSAVSKQGIAVEYARTSHSSSEMFLPVGDKVRLERVGALNQIKPGDTVKVRFEQTVKEDDKGKKIVLGTTATEIAMMRRAPEEGSMLSKEKETE